MGWLDTLLDAGTSYVSDSDNWGDIISGGIQLYGSNRAADQQEESLDRIAQRTLEASRPKSVYGPMSQAQYDPNTESYSLGLSPAVAGMFGQQLGDVQRFRKQREPIMGNLEAEALRRTNETRAALEPGRQDRFGQALSTLYGKGLATSTLGTDALSQLSSQERVEDVASMAANRAAIQSEVTTLLDRETGARKAMTGFGALPQELANIGTGIGSNMASAAYQSQQPLIKAAGGQKDYTLGMFGGLGSAAQDIWGQKQATQQVQPYSGYRMIDGIGVSNYS